MERLNGRFSGGIEKARMHATRLTVAAGLFIVAERAGLLPEPVSNLIEPTPVSADHNPETHKNWQIPGGWFFTETRGSAPYPAGFSVTGAVWEAYQRNGGAEVWGPPVSQPFIDSIGRLNQAIQRGVFQLTVSGGRVQRVEWMNVFDLLRQRGIKPPFTPDSMGWPGDSELPFRGTNPLFPGSIEERHIREVFRQKEGRNPVEQKYLDILRREWLSNPRWLEQYGLPTGVQDFGPAVVAGGQRAQLQLWKEKQAWTSAPMQVSVALGGDIAKKYGLIPAEAVNPILLNGVKQEVLVPGEFRIGNILFRNFSPEDQQYIKDSFAWLQGTGARIKFRGQEMTIWDFIQTSPIPYIEFNTTMRPPALTRAWDGGVLLKPEALRYPEYSPEAQWVIMVGYINHEGGAHSRQYKERNFQVTCGEALEMELEAWTVELDTYKALLPYLSSAQGEINFLIGWMQEQIRNKSFDYCLPPRP